MDSVIRNHVNQSIENAPAWVESWTKNEAGEILPARHIAVKIQEYVNGYMAKKSTKRWVIVPGLRGVGKTTILAQQYNFVRQRYGNRVNMLHLSLHDVVNVVGSNLNLAIQQYEAIIGSSIERLDKPTFLFLDEVQEDSKWADILFSLHERSRNIFIICTGSSAVHLRMNANVVRRSHIEPLYPLNYTEYQMLRFNIMPITGLKAKLTQAVFSCTDANQAHEELKKLAPVVGRYRSKIDVGTFIHFMYTGSLPFLINEDNPAQVYRGIISMIERIVNEDLAKIYNFDGSSLSAVQPLLFMLAEGGDVISRKSLSSALGIDARIVGNLLDALVKTELLIEVPARGATSVAVSKPRKYLFMSPAIRAAFHQIAGVPATDERRKGFLLEDLVGLYMHREFVTKRLADFTYNAGTGHADFMLQTAAGKRIPIEVGVGQKGATQVEKTMAEVSSNYGIVLSSTQLGVDRVRNILYLPLSIFYFM